MPHTSDLDEFMRLGAEAKLHPDWEIFGAFAELRGKGVRSEALNKLKCFLDSAEQWPFNERLDFARWLLGESRKFSKSSLPIPGPAHERLILPTIREWAKAAPHAAEASLWLGLLRCDDPVRHLERALELDPSCDMATRTLVEWIIADIEYNQHHLPAFYIHDPQIDLKALDRANSMIDGRNANEWTEIRKEISELRQHAAEWVARKGSRHTV